ncbi:RxLR effector protein [Phytophthora megakarya]|uniref:RxLR effector protein n=1 Tax=Phytophthora megakarya TaxID=4795 RepID=A0A225WAG6_9STRA|nr:RxLR effector protein [Phytophthora megakarya]
MRLQLSIVLVVLVTLIKSSSVVLADQFGLKESSKFKSSVSTPIEDVRKRHLRLGGEVKSDDDVSFPAKNEEERVNGGSTLSKVLSDARITMKQNTMDMILWTAYKLGRTPEKVFAKASRQTDSAKRATIERHARIFEKWIKKNYGP